MNRRLLFGAIALLIPALAGCEAGLNAPTLQYHPASNGASVIHDGITIDNAFVLGSASGSVPKGGRAGLFVSLQSENGDRLESITASGTASSVNVTGGSINLPSEQLVDLSGPAPKIVLTGLTNALSGGQTIQLTFTFAEAQAITLGVPVEPRSYEYATYSPPAALPTKSVTPQPTAPVTPGASVKGSSTPGATASPTPTG